MLLFYSSVEGRNQMRQEPRIIINTMMDAMDDGKEDESGDRRHGTRGGGRCVITEE